MRRRNPFPGVTRAPDRHGKVRWRFRRKGFSCYLPGAYGSAEFRTAYEQARQGALGPQPTERFSRGTLAWLIVQYRNSPKYLDQAEASKRTLRGQLDWLMQVAGDLPFARLETRHVEALMAKKEGPAAANRVKKNLSLLFNYAAKHGWATHNPARHADRRKVSGSGYHTWTDAEIAQYLDYHGEGTRARRALMLFLCTGASRQDAAGLGWQHVKDGRIRFARGKTGVVADLPILPELAAELADVPKGDVLFLTHGAGRPYKATTLGNWFKDQCKAAGLDHCSAHGLRKAGATRLAEAGATEMEVMAFLAHASPKEAATYTKKAARATLADHAFDRLAGTKPERNVSNLSQRLGKKGSKSVKKQ
ncbi:tyrosine-type recombinase/integrase [Ovoidimarina sediminis]|uniref:tyrosine-type recombinase/integrase n=1 Tax=Ovoidimarina sediminis TaxID=3079856 RepID=UPI0029120236|nr:tyrosine-type recombinase/integrase [Rhodophyticola sp. MJ-SS7]MDU8946106.1 tyrosine-type recombinase/integrase [Rhodophyticola sp. MJ-SS7]